MQKLLFKAAKVAARCCNLLEMPFNMIEELIGKSVSNKIKTFFPPHHESNLNRRIQYPELKELCQVLTVILDPSPPYLALSAEFQYQST